MVDVLDKDVEKNNIGTVISDDASPSFEIFKFKAKPNRYVTPGTLVATPVKENIFLVGRVTSSHEYNPHETPSKVTVRDVMGITPDYPDEDMSLTIHRRYEVEIIKEVNATSTGYEIYPPEKMPKSGNEVFIPPKKVIMEIMGLEVDPEKVCTWDPLLFQLVKKERYPQELSGRLYKGIYSLGVLRVAENLTQQEFSLRKFTSIISLSYFLTHSTSLFL